MADTIIKVSNVDCCGRTIYFTPELQFTAKYVNKIDKDKLDSWYWYIDDKELNIDAMGKTLDELIEDLKENIRIQWDGIAMESDENLDLDSLKIKKKLIERWDHE
jgi:predicted RNase H-like HicB family nuclease